MRLRHIRGAAQQVAAQALAVTQREAEAGPQWQQRFAQAQPLHVEIGMGRGRFISALAAAAPQINYVGLELRAEVILDALAGLPESAPDNLLFLHASAEALDLMFAAASVEQIYLLFSDPWPKQRHAKRRLTAPAFITRYSRILQPAGRLVLKTDGAAFYHWSCANFAAAGWTLLAGSEDWPRGEGEIVSEYEGRFRARGLPIYYAAFTPPEQEDGCWKTDIGGRMSEDGIEEKPDR